MGSAKHDMAITQVMNLLNEWDKGSKSVRRKILQDFIAQNQNKTGPELEAIFAQAASLFLTRLTAWLRLTYMIGTCVNEQLQALQIFLAASSGHKYLSEFLEVGGVLTILEILGLKQSKEKDKSEALKLLMCIANAGRKYKELICESYGIRAIAECLAKSRSDDTQENVRNLLQMLAEGNPKFEIQVYKGLIALLPCSSPKAQQMAAQTLRIVQPIIKEANLSMVDPLLGLLKTLHLEVQFEAIELIRDLMSYDIRPKILRRLVILLRPSKDDIDSRPEILDDPSVPKMQPSLPIYIQQAAAAKCIGILARDSEQLADELIQNRVIHHLLYVIGNMQYADSQRLAAITLEYFCQSYPLVDEHVREAMGDNLYKTFVTNPEILYTKMNAIQADVLIFNKVNIPGTSEEND